MGAVTFRYWSLLLVLLLLSGCFGACPAPSCSDTYTRKYYTDFLGCWGPYSESCNSKNNYYCSGNTREYRRYYCSGGNCNYYVSSSTNCYAPNYCSGSTRYYNFRCSGSSCTNDQQSCSTSSSCSGDTRVYNGCEPNGCFTGRRENCNNDYYYCNGDTRYFSNGYCSGGSCTSSSSVVETCSDYKQCVGSVLQYIDSSCTSSGCLKTVTSGVSCLYGCENGYLGPQCKPNPYYCGDGSCNNFETCTSCSSDCGTCCNQATCNSNDVKQCTINGPVIKDYECSGSNCVLVTNWGQSCSCCEINFAGNPECKNPACSTDCNLQDGSYCNGNTREFRDYYCSCGSCTYVVTSSSNCPGGCSNGACLPYCGDGYCNNGESCSSCSNDCGSCCKSHDYTACSGSNVYWFNSCGTRQELITNCSAGLGVCEIGSCSAGSCIKSFKSNCCGNFVCESSESCSTCSDCSCKLGIDLSSFECYVNGKSCSAGVNAGDTLLARFKLVNASHPSGISVRVSLSSSSGSISTFTVTSSSVEKSLILPSGRQTLSVSVTDLIDNDVASGVLAVINVNGTSSSINFSNAVYPFNYVNGSYDTLPPGVPLEDYGFTYDPVTGTYVLVASASVALAYLKKRNLMHDTYVPNNPQAFINEANKRQEEANKAKEFLTSVFNGLAGVRTDSTSSLIDNVKLVISAGQFVFFGLGFINPIFFGLAAACAVIDNVNDGTELGTNVIGWLNAKNKGDNERANEHFWNGLFASFAFVPVGDLVQDGKKGLKALGIIKDVPKVADAVQDASKVVNNAGDVAQGVSKAKDPITEAISAGKKAGKLSDEVAKALENSLNALKKLGKHQDFVNKILSKIDLDNDTAKILTRITDQLQKVAIKVDISDSLNIAKKQLSVIDEALSYTDDALKSTKEVARRLGKTVSEPYELLFSNDLPGFGANANGLIKIDVEKLVADTNPNHVYEVVNHEYLHQVTNLFNNKINNIMSDYSDDFFANNEARDLLVRKYVKENPDLFDSRKFLDYFDNRFNNIIEDLLKNPGKITGEDISILAEKAVIEGENSNIIKVLGDIQTELLKDVTNSESISGIVKITDIFNLKDAFLEVLSNV